MSEENMRLRLTKTGRAIYISHLDFMRTMQRAFLRAELPLKYSEGFNPHAQISFPLPLSLGTSSLCEILDFKLNSYFAPDEITFRLNRSLPEGIKVLETYVPERKSKFIKWLDADGTFEYSDRPPSDVINELTDFFAQSSIVIEKKTKSGMGTADIVPAIRSLVFDTEKSAVTVRATVSAQEPTLNPDNLVTALRQLRPELAPDYAFFTRVQIYDAYMNVFR